MKTQQEIIRHYAQFGVECIIKISHDTEPCIVLIDGACEDLVYSKACNECWPYCDVIAPILRSPKNIPRENCVDILGRVAGLWAFDQAKDGEMKIVINGLMQEQLFKMWELNVDTFGAIEAGLAIKKEV